MSSAAELTVRLTETEERPGLPKLAGEPGVLVVTGGAAVSDGARTPLGGDLSRRASSWWRRGGGGGASPSPRSRTGSGRAPPEGDRGGGRGWAPGLWGSGPGSSWAGAGATGRALGLRLGGGGGAGLARGRTPRGLQGLGEGPRGRPLPWGGGGGCSLPGGRRGPLLSGGGGAGVCRPVSGHVNLCPRHGTISPTLRAGVNFLGGMGWGAGEWGGGGVAVCPLPGGGGGSPVGASSGVAEEKPGGVPGPLGPFVGEPRIHRGGLRHIYITTPLSP